MERLRKELTFEGGVNLQDDPHLLKSNEWQLLQNLWPYSNKLLGTRPSLLHEQDVLPVPPQYWNGFLSLGTAPPYPTVIANYHQWFRFLTPLKAVFLGSLDTMALVCVCNTGDSVMINEHFEGEDATTPMLNAGDVILMLTPNDLLPATTESVPIISAVRLGSITNLTPSLINFNGDIIAANKSCEYVVRVVKKSSLPTPSDTVWPDIDYRFTKVDFGPTNLGFRVDGVIVYKNRFVYWKGNRLWFSDPFQPQLIYPNAVETAYLAVFFDTGLTEDITALGNIYMSDIEEAGKSVLSIWTQHGMLFMTGEPATTIASTADELFTDCKVNTISAKAGCVSAASVVKTKFGYIWCGAESVWFMARGNLPVEVGYKIGPRIKAQSFESSGRIFATFDDMCYRLIINAPGVGYNPYGALNEMWCLSFIGNTPSKETAAWFGPQVFTNTDNAQDASQYPGGNPGVFCCAQLTNINDNITYYVQPYSMLSHTTPSPTTIGTRLGLATITQYLGADITAPFRPSTTFNDTYNYSVGATFNMSRGQIGFFAEYCIDYVVTEAGVLDAGLDYIQIYTDVNEPLYTVRPVTYNTEEIGLNPAVHKIVIQAGNLTFDNSDLMKLVDGYELTFKTLNPIIIKSWWWPWEPSNIASNIVTLESPVNVPQNTANLLGGMFNEPVLTTRRIPSPVDKRYNGLTAQLNIEEADYKVVGTNKNITPVWDKIRISINNVDWFEFNLFDYDTNNIAKYTSVLELLPLLVNKCNAEGEFSLAFAQPKYGILGIQDNRGPDAAIYIDMNAQGWQWFGFVPTGLDLGYGMNIVSTVDDPTDYVYSTGPIPLCTPHSIHLAKLSARYAILEARPR